MKVPCVDCICLSICRWKTPAKLIEDCDLVFKYIRGKEKESSKERISNVVDVLYDGVEIKDLGER